MGIPTAKGSWKDAMGITEVKHLGNGDHPINWNTLVLRMCKDKHPGQKKDIHSPCQAEKDLASCRTVHPMEGLTARDSLRQRKYAARLHGTTLRREDSVLLCWQNEMWDGSPYPFPFLGGLPFVLDKVTEWVMFRLKLFPESLKQLFGLTPGASGDVATSYSDTQGSGERASQSQWALLLGLLLPCPFCPHFLVPVNLKLSMYLSQLNLNFR